MRMEVVPETPKTGDVPEQSLPQPILEPPKAKTKELSPRLARATGIRQAAFSHKLRKQNVRCGICDLQFLDNRQIKVDHDHDSGYARGLLCNQCNLGLGHFKDSPELLETAARYLRAHAIKILDKRLRNGARVAKDEQRSLHVNRRFWTLGDIIQRGIFPHFSEQRLEQAMAEGTFPQPSMTVDEQLVWTVEDIGAMYKQRRIAKKVKALENDPSSLKLRPSLVKLGKLGRRAF